MIVVYLELRLFPPFALYFRFLKIKFARTIEKKPISNNNNN